MCIGLSSVDHMPFIPASETSETSQTDVDRKVDFVYDSFVKEEVVDIEEEDVDNVNNNEDFKELPKIIQQPQLLKTTPRTVVISSKQSNRPIAISKHMSNLTKPVFIPINLSNVKTIKVRNIFHTFNV